MIVYEWSQQCEKKACSHEHTCLRTQGREIRCREGGHFGLSESTFHICTVRIPRRSLNKPRLILIHYPPVNTNNPPYSSELTQIIP
jgi:hypothetical protein